MLNKQQSEAMSQILAWFENANLTGRQVYTLGGYAGTGKTFLINQVVEALNLKDHEVAFATYTGKAASVIIQRGTDASTIHRLIYTAVDEDYETEMNGEKIKSHRIKFVKKESIPSYKLIVIDEISMVDEKTMKDLLSFGIPLLATGDPGQLPPIQGENPLIKNPNYFLTEIVRQAEDNAIIKIATMARNGEPIPYGNYGDVIVLDRRAITLNIQKKLLLKADQVICGTNATRIYLNNEIRKMKDIDIIESKYPLDGEKVIWSVNN
jgi:exodeoxyribonuclease-5